MFGVDPREHRAEQDDLRGIVDPQQDDHDRTGCTIDRGDAGRGQIPADQVIAEQEQQAAGARPDPNVAPGDLGVGQDAVDQRDGQREERPGDGERDGPPEREALGRGRGGQDLAERGEDRRDQQVGQQQRADSQDGQERSEPIVQASSQSPPRFGLDLPDRVQRALQLAEQPGGAKPKEDNAQDRRRDPRAALVRVFRGGLDGRRPRCGPTVLSISWVNRPCAASLPRTRLAAVKASTITGAMEKMA